MHLFPSLLKSSSLFGGMLLCLLACDATPATESAPTNTVEAEPASVQVAPQVEGAAATDRESSAAQTATEAQQAVGAQDFHSPAAGALPAAEQVAQSPSTAEPTAGTARAATGGTSAAAAPATHTGGMTHQNDAKTASQHVPTAGVPANKPIESERTKGPTSSSELDGQSETAPTQEPAASPDHAAFSALLAKYVSGTGKVNYAGLKSDRSKLDAYLAALAEQAPQDSWSRNEQLAYYINLYNATTLRLILDHHPVASIQDIHGGKPWDQPIVKFGDRTVSLNQLENEIIRPTFKEPRIHFAVNCAAKGCPPLRNEAFVANRLEAQLQEQTREFVNDDRYNSVDGQMLRLSRIFDWYGEDFGDVENFVGRYRDVPAGAEVNFVDYDWSLNQ